jgi:hypothetical protein
VDLGIQFFTAAKAQHESGAKWSLIVLVVPAYLHLAIVGPFAAQTADMAAIDGILRFIRRRNGIWRQSSAWRRTSWRPSSQR